MNKYTGFTLIELMLTITVAGILMAIALPSYTNMTKNNCLTTSVNSLVAALQRARSEAIKSRSDVTVSAKNGNWGTGWTVTLNEDRNGNGTKDAGEDYNGNGALDSSVVVLDTTLTCTATITEGSSPVKTSLTYGSNGFVQTTSNTAGTFTVCDDRVAERGRQLTISITGRPNIDSDFTCD